MVEPSQLGERDRVTERAWGERGEGSEGKDRSWVGGEAMAATGLYMSTPQRSKWSEEHRDASTYPSVNIHV